MGFLKTVLTAAAISTAALCTYPATAQDASPAAIPRR